MAPVQKAQKAQKVPIVAKRTVCNAGDYLILLEYLEDQTNFVKLFGSGKKTAVGGKYLKRSNSWDVAAVELKAEGFQETNGKNLYKKWQRYFTKYREARKISKDTGGGLTKEDVDKGLSLEDKLNSMCEHFYKMDRLMGHQVNVDPAATSGPMGFEAFGETSVKGEPSNTPLVESNTPFVEFINLDSSSPTQEQQIESPLPSWVDEAEGEQESHQHGGEEDGVEHEEGLQELQRVRVQEELPQQEAPSITKAAPKHHSQKKKPSAVAEQTLSKKDCPPVKHSLAHVYQECKIQEAEFRYKAIERKEAWKMAEISDKKQARIDDLKKRKVELEFELEQKRFAKEDVSLEAHRERMHKVEEAEKSRSHEGLVSKRQIKLDLVKSGWAQNKPQGEIDHFLSMICDDY